ncbi:NAD(+)/NADH kinase [Pleomorphochaeta sp. DL1XJH-081]|jgi:NAD+ kinase|uniref:NAD(+)/NADH kinase n=1 Tax=Pleomorphochaeta sp. DL1XJH-081 TaxID=3409690 RepID=UPI003BB5DAB4
MIQVQARNIRRVVILANKNKVEAETLVSDIQNYLDELGIPNDCIYTVDADESIALHTDSDLAICLGGDGTVLSCARLLHPYGIPMLAVNLGTFGFITEVCKDEWKEAFEHYRSGTAEVSRRLMVRVSVFRDGNRVFQGHGLNEMTIAASGISKMVSLDLLINGTNAGKIRSDGIIVATPTGSTGYSLAAGGPILDADLDALIINPVCPFTLSNRPLVIAGEDVVEVVVREKQKTQISLTVDGQVFFPLIEGDRVVVEKARSKALLVVSPMRNYHEVIRDKLNWSGGMHA